MSVKIKYLILIFSLLLIALGVYLLLNKSYQPSSEPLPSPVQIHTSALPFPEKSQEVLATRIIDGDTFVVEGNVKIRYIGINSPESGKCFGSEASVANLNLISNKKVRLEYDIEKLDKYGRTLAYVWIGNTFINEELVKQGFAQVATYPPNVKYVEIFKKAEKEAREQKIGLWATSTCDQYKSENNSTASTESVKSVSSASSECNIKGNINSKGEKIYHTPGQRYYDKTQVEESKGERWFCSESEAEAAGWRKSKV